MSAVFVSGFDSDTTITTVFLHFSTIALVENVQFVGQGNAVVTYESSEAAGRAVIQLNNSTMQGNRRYVTVMIDHGGNGKGKDGKDSSGVAGYDNSHLKGCDMDRGKSCYGKGGYGKGGGGRDHFDGDTQNVFVPPFSGHPGYDKGHGKGGYGNGNRKGGRGRDRFDGDGETQNVFVPPFSGHPGYDKGHSKGGYGNGNGKGGRGRDHFDGETQNVFVPPFSGHPGYDKGHSKGGYGNGNGKGGRGRDYFDGEMKESAEGRVWDSGSLEASDDRYDPAVNSKMPNLLSRRARGGAASSGLCGVGSDTRASGGELDGASSSESPLEKALKLAHEDPGRAPEALKVAKELMAMRRDRSQNASKQQDLA
ncbi:cspJ [Symbiodinium sp. CCMP2592]|nr:cspJ [Symbiodinium sp. CCMP2592]